jgi:hypothetical protein
MGRLRGGISRVLPDIRLQDIWAWGLYHETKKHERVVHLFHLAHQQRSIDFLLSHS